MTDDETVQRLDINRILREAYDARGAIITEKVLEAVGNRAPWDVRTVTSFEFDPVEVPDQYTAGRYVQATRVSIEVTRWNEPKEDQDELGYVRVQLYSHPLREDGKLDGRGRPSWGNGPDELAAPLLLAALTRSTKPKKED